MPTAPQQPVQEFSPTTFSEAAAVENLLKVGKKNFFEKDYQTALRYYNKALALDPDNKDANFHKKEIEYEISKASVDSKKGSIKQSQQKGYSKPDYRLALGKPKKSSSSKRRGSNRISRGSLMKPLILALIALIFIGASLIGPWYTMSMKTEIEIMGENAEATSDIAYTFQEVKVESDSPIITISATKSLDDKEFKDSKAIDAIKTTNLLTILAVIMAILFFIFILISGLKGSRTLCLVAMIFGILTIIGGFLAPMFLMTGYPAGLEADEKEQWEDSKEMWENFRGSSSNFPEYERSIFAESFWGSESEESELGSFEMAWGAGWGWYLCLIGGILAILAVVFTIRMIMKF